MTATDKEASMEQRNVSLWPLTAIMFGALLIQIIIAFVIVRMIPTTWQDRSGFGEMFGAVNTLFSGWAFAGVIYTLLLQKRALEEQRSQFQRADVELAKTEQARATTHDKLTRQAEALQLAVEIKAMNILIGFYDQEYKAAEPEEKTTLRNKKRKMCARLETLINPEL